MRLSAASGQRTGLGRMPHTGSHTQARHTHTRAQRNKPHSHSHLYANHASHSPREHGRGRGRRHRRGSRRAHVDNWGRGRTQGNVGRTSGWLKQIGSTAGAPTLVERRLRKHVVSASFRPSLGHDAWRQKLAKGIKNGGCGVHSHLHSHAPRRRGRRR